MRFGLLVNGARNVTLNFMNDSLRTYVSILLAAAHESISGESFIAKIIVKPNMPSKEG